MAFPQIGVEAIMATQNFVRGMGVYNSGVDTMIEGSRQVADEAEKQAARQEEAARSIQKVGVAMSLAGAAGLALAKKIAGTAARVQELGIVMAAMGKNAGISAKQIALEEEKVKSLGITTQAARNLLIQFMGSQLKVADAAKIARAAQDLAVVAMKDSSEAAQIMTRAIANLSPMLLRQFGLNVTLTQSQLEMGKSLGIVTEQVTEAGKVQRIWSRELTNTEKKQALLNSILQQASSFTGVYEDAMTSAGKQMRSMARHVEEAAVAFGQHLLPMMGLVVQGFTSLLKALLNVPDNLKAVAANALALGSVFLTVAGGLTLILPKLTAMIASLKAVMTGATAATAAFNPLALAIAAIATALLFTVQAAQKVNQTFATAADAVLSTSTSYETYKRAVIEAAIETKKLRGSVEMFINVDERHFKQLGLTSDQYNKYKRAVRESEGAVKSYTDSLAWYDEQLQKSLVHEEKRLEALKASVTWSKEYEHEMRKLGIETGKFAGATEKAAAAIDFLTNTAKSYQMAVKQSGVATEQFSSSVEGAQENIWSMKNTFEAALPALKAWDEGVQALADTWDEMDVFITKFQDDILVAQEKFQQQSIKSLESFNISRRQSELQYYRGREILIAESEANINALREAGEDERADKAQKNLEKELAMRKFQYAEQQAWAKWNFDIQQKLQEIAHQQRLQEFAEFAKKDAEIQIALLQASIDVMMLDLSATQDWAKGKIQAQLAVTGVTVDAAKIEIATLKARQDAWRHALFSIEADLTKFQEEIMSLQGELDVLLEVGPLLPDLPDFSKFATEMASGISGAGRQVRESATKTFAEVTEDIAKAIRLALDTFEEVAAYEPPVGLAAGMEAIRKDIQEAVRQLYIAFEAIGEDGVVGAGLIAEAAVVIFEAIGKAVDTFTKLKEYSAPLRSAIDGLLADVRHVLVQVRTNLLDLWGWAGQRTDTVWGHMISWAEAVGGIVRVVGQAVEAFKGLEGFTGVLPGAIEALVRDIARVLNALRTVDPEGVDEAMVAWAKFAAALIASVASMIGDMQKLAELEGELRISWSSLTNLILNLGTAVSNILMAIGRISMPVTEVHRLRAEWLEFAAGLVSTLAGAIDDLQKMTTLEGELRIQWSALTNLVLNLGTAVSNIMLAIGRIMLPITEVERLKAEWLQFASGLISTLASVIDDMKALTDFEGGLAIAGQNVIDLVDEMQEVTNTILEAMQGAEETFTWATREADELKAEWLNFSAGLLGALAQVVEDLKTIADYPGLTEGFEEAARMLAADLKLAVDKIVEAIGDVTQDFRDAEGEIDTTVADWVDITTGIVSSIAGAASDMATIAEFVELPDIAAGAVALTRNLKTAVAAIVAAVGDVSADFDDAGVFVHQKTADWVGIVAGMVSDLAGVASSLTEIAGIRTAVPVQGIEALAAIMRLVMEELAALAEDFDADARQAAEDFASVLTHMTSVMDSIGGLARQMLALWEDNIIRQVWQHLSGGIEGTLIGRVVIALVALLKFIGEQIAPLRADLNMPALEASLGVVDDLTSAVADAINALTITLSMPVPGGASIDGFIAAVRSVHARLISQLGQLELNMGAAGYSVGSALIQGMISGLQSQTGALYALIQAIVEQAIATAIAAAGGGGVIPPGEGGTIPIVNPAGVTSGLRGLAPSRVTATRSYDPFGGRPNVTQISGVVSGNTFVVREEADIDRVSAAVVEAMREDLGSITDRRQRHG